MSESPRNPEQVLRRLEWTVIRRLDGLLHGDYRTLFRGSGLDLADLREYQYHDDVRHIDWNVTARLATPYVREYHEDRDLTAWFLLDLSPSLDFGSGEREQARRGERIRRRAGAAAEPAMATASARIFYGDRVDTVIPAKSGRRHVLHILHAMARAPGALALGRDRSQGPVAGGLGADAPPLAGVRRFRFHQRARLAESARAHRAAPRSDRGAALRSAGDASCPISAGCRSRMRRPASSSTSTPTIAGFRRRFARLAEQREKALRSAFWQAGVDALELSTDDDLVDAILRFADLRKRRSQLGGGGMLPRASRTHA